MMQLDRFKALVKGDWDRIVEKCHEFGILPYENAVNEFSAISLGVIGPENALPALLAVAHSIASSDDPQGAYEELCAWASTVCDEKPKESIHESMDKEKN
jgi:hypothetical protein